VLKLRRAVANIAAITVPNGVVAERRYPQILSGVTTA